MSFGTAIATSFRKYADFTGTASRSEFWWFNLLLVLVSLALSTLWAPLGGVFFFVTVVPLPRGGCASFARCQLGLGINLHWSCACSWHHRPDCAVGAAHRGGGARSLEARTIPRGSLFCPG